MWLVCSADSPAPYIGDAARDTKSRALSWGIEKLERLPQAVSFPAEQRPLSCARTAARRGCPPLCGFFLPAPYVGCVNEKWEQEKAELIHRVLEPARETIKQIAKDRHPKDLKNQNLYGVQLTNEAIRALKIYLNWMSAEALYTGTEIAEIGAAIGGSQNQSNVRRKLPLMKTFESAIAEANDRKKPVDVTIDGLTIQINPDN